VLIRFIYNRGFFGKYFRAKFVPSQILSAYAVEWPFQVLLVFIYLVVTFGGKAPGCPRYAYSDQCKDELVTPYICRGYIGAGGLEENSEHWECTGGMHRYVDMKVGRA
jgi:hypothetical protein